MYAQISYSNDQKLTLTGVCLNFLIAQHTQLKEKRLLSAQFVEVSGHSQIVLKQGGVADGHPGGETSHGEQGREKAASSQTSQLPDSASRL